MQDIRESVFSAESILIRKDGAKRRIWKESDSFEKLTQAWQRMTAQAAQMPAFGVSLDALTRQEYVKGLWIEMFFAKDQLCWEMPFSRLLIPLVKNSCGFNLIRYSGGEYGGRCFYLDLRGETTDLFCATVESVYAE